MFLSNPHHVLFKAHHAVSVGTQDDSPLPRTHGAVMLANEVTYDAENGPSPEEAELAELLSSPHISALLTSHDRVANKEWPLQPVVPEGAEGGVVEMTGPVRVVQVEKEKEPLVSTFNISLCKIYVERKKFFFMDKKRNP